MHTYSPSLMCMNLTKFKEQVEVLNERADFYHVDIMDGHFVPNLTLSPYFIGELKRISSLPIEAHLMIREPELFINLVLDAGADYISLHAETINGKAFRLISQIKERGCKVGIVLNPETPLEEIGQYIHHIDKLTIMTVDPGFAGQAFIPEMLEKVKKAASWKRENNYNYIISVDGSCNSSTYKLLTEAGAENFVLGSTGLFNLNKNLVNAWEEMLYEFKQATLNFTK